MDDKNTKEQPAQPVRRGETMAQFLDRYPKQMQEAMEARAKAARDEKKS